LKTRRHFFASTIFSSGAFGICNLSGQVRSTRKKERTQSVSGEPLDRLLSLYDYETAARDRITHAAYEYVASGAGDELTLKWNRESLDKIRLWPRTLVQPSPVETRTQLLGQDLAFPILLAPTGFQRAVHPEGEIATARGAGIAGAIYVVSTSTTTRIEDIARAATTPLWFQVYMQPDRGFMREMVGMAEAAGVKALCVTVDQAAPGIRNRQQRSGFKLPPGITTPYLSGGRAWGDRPVTGNAFPVAPQDIEWLRSTVRVPVLLKGILHPEDADIAAKAGTAGVIVSNHGARVLDTVAPTIDALPRVADKVAGRVPVLMDGGIRRGTDVMKALALGANAVLIGRPYLYGLGVGGADGVTRVINILRHEFEMTMALTGRRTIASIDRSVLWPG
jgi:4-hydroxymandelate oxidase